MKKQTILPILLGALTLTVSACAGGSDPSTGDNVFEIIAPKNAMADAYETMQILTDIAEQANVEIEWQNLTGSAYSTQKTTIMANRSKWPDAIYHAGFTNKELIQYGSSRNYIVAIDKYLDHMPRLKEIFEARPDIKAALESPDGHIYSLPRIEEMGLKPYPNILFLNKEWVGQLIDSNKLSFNLNKSDLVDGLSLTRNQYKEILTHFKTLDMNGNGNVNDEIPLSFVSGNWQGNESDLLASFGIPENKDHKTIVNDQVVFTCQDTKWRDAISEISTWVGNGLIDPAAFEDSQDAFLAKGKNDAGGKPKFGSFYWWELETVVSPNQYDNYIVVKPLIDDNTGMRYVGVSNELEIEKGVAVIFSKCDNIPLLCSYFDKFYEPYNSAQINYGPIGVVFEEELDENNMLVTKDLPEGVTADELRLKYAPMGAICLTENEWNNYVHMEPRAKLRLERLEQYIKPYTMENVKSIPNITYSLEEINTLSQYETTLGTTISSFFVAQMIAGRAISEAEWNQFQQRLTASGIETVKQINQTGYDRLRGI